jgi:hypothetical protein
LSHRLDEGLASWATEYGASRGTSRAVVIEEALRHFQALSKGGVPDLPVVDTPEVRAVRAEKYVETKADWDTARQRGLNSAKYRRAG